MISEIRYWHLVFEAGTLLSELRRLGASYEDLKRDAALMDHVSRETIGSVIHDLQSQIQGLERANADDDINPDCFDLADEDDDDSYGL